MEPITETHPIEIREPVGVLGYGMEGASTCRYLLARGYSDITVFDRNPPAGLDPRIAYAGADGPRGPGDYLARLASVKTLFRSAGVRPDLPEIGEFLRAGGGLTSQTGLAISLAGRHRIIGVTGTVGKGTCCSLLKAILDEAGIPCALGGNIGVPALDLAASLGKDGHLLLELSSFQLSALAESPSAAIVLRTTSEHLDWHLSRDEYWLHKSRLVSGQEAADLLVHCADAPGSAWIAGRSRARKIAFGARSPVEIADGAVRWVTRGLTLPLAAIRLKGVFNLENVAAAGAMALELGAEPRHVEAAARAFPGLEHRLEFVRSARGLDFYNDSYATRPEATMGAIAALAGAPLGLILGGSDKRADFSELVAGVAGARHVRALALIGQTAPRLEAELRAAGAHSGRALRRCAGLGEALEFLVSELGSGTVALSPACASFGLFENYKERGKAFKRLVDAL